MIQLTCPATSRVFTPVKVSLLLSLSVLVFHLPMTLGAESATRVRIANLTYAGERLSNSENLVVFRGIPYAQPPVGDLRWVAPRPLQYKRKHGDESDPVKAGTFAPRCPQDDGNINWYRNVAAAFGDADARSTRKIVAKR